MADVIKLRKGLDINLKGKASMDVTLQVKQAEDLQLLQVRFRNCLNRPILQQASLIRLLLHYLRNLNILWKQSMR